MNFWVKEGNKKSIYACLKLYQEVLQLVMKKYISRICVVLLTLVMLMSMAVSAYAAPDVLPAEVESTVEGLLTLKAPEQLITSTDNKKLPISATVPEGAQVTVYRFDASTGCYHKIVVDDVPMETTVGATMLYAGQVDLTTGNNKFLIRGGWDDSVYTVVKFEVNLLHIGFMDRIKGVISSIFN